MFENATSKPLFGFCPSRGKKIQAAPAPNCFIDNEYVFSPEVNHHCTERPDSISPATHAAHLWRDLTPPGRLGLDPHCWAATVRFQFRAHQRSHCATRKLRLFLLRSIPLLLHLPESSFDASRKPVFFEMGSPQRLAATPPIPSPSNLVRPSCSFHGMFKSSFPFELWSKVGTPITQFQSLGNLPHPLVGFPLLWSFQSFIGMQLRVTLSGTDNSVGPSYAAGPLSNLLSIFQTTNSNVPSQ